MQRTLAIRVFAPLMGAALFTVLSQPAAGEDPKPGTLVSVAGTGPTGLAEDGVLATQAPLHMPLGMAIDAAGNLFLAETHNNRVRRISPEGILSTFAGTGPVGMDNGGFGGDGGPAREARLFFPAYLALDGTGNLYFADRWNHRLRKVSADGIITTVAGTGKEGSSGDGGPAAEAALKSPHSVAFDAEGSFFITDTANQRVRKVDKNGIMTTVAGSGKKGFSGDGGPATDARFDSPTDLAVDAAGNLYISDTLNNRVRKVDKDGVISTVAGNGEQGFSGDGGKATEAMLAYPTGVAVDSAGNLFIADWLNNRVRKVAPDGIITTVAGSDKTTFSGEGGPATEAGLRGPGGLTIDAAGNLYIADTGVFKEDDGLGFSERVLKVIGAAAPGLLAGKPFPQ